MEIDKGNGFNDQYVHLDLRHLGREKIHKLLPGIQEVCIHFGGFDPVDKPIPIQPAQHYSMGGIDVDNAGASSIAGFFAAGECACVSVHGANRLGGNSLLDGVVFGKLAGRAASAYIKGSSGKSNVDQALIADSEAYVAKIKELRSREKGENVFKLLNDLKELMSENVGIFRKQRPLEVALEGIKALREGYKEVGLHGASERYSQELITLIEFDYMLDIAEVIVLGALTRTETRGSHYRTDYPVRNDDDWLKHTLMTWTDKGPKISYRPIKIDKYKLEARKY
jgi:succinate dehydrogenase/fumarate reductase flavoprotein subunit